MKSMRIACDEPGSRAIPRREDLTEARIKKLACPVGKDRVYVFDNRTPGLAVCITAVGSRSYYLIRKVKKTKTRLRLGGIEISLEQARQLAAKANGKIAEGENPQALRRMEREAPTFKDLFEHFIEHHAKPHKRTWQGDVDQRERYLAGWLSRKASSVEQADVQALHIRIGRNHGEYAANRLLALLSKVFNVAGEMRVKMQNPCKGVRKFKEHSRERFLQPDELPRFFKALDDEPNTTIADFVRMLLLTGARRSNAQSMRWEEISLEKSTWTIPATKSKNATPLTVHLPLPALAILSQLKTTSQNPWVFPARHGQSGHLTEPKAAWASLLKRAQITDLRLHDLRRTYGSWMAAGGASLPIIGRALGHKSPNTTAIYARLNLDPTRAAVNSAIDAMTAAATVGPKDFPPA